MYFLKKLLKPINKKTLVFTYTVLSFNINIIMSNNQKPDSFPSSGTFNSGRSKKDGKSKDPTIETVAQLIEAGKAKRIIVMSGAGISTAAGIPDFRTPGTGLYDNLQKYNLPYPEAIFDIGYFKGNPEPFFSLTRELYPGKFLPTLTHYFLTLLHRKNLLHRCFTQNIDTLERLAGLPDDMVVEAHGSFAKSKCLKCGKFADAEWMKDMVNKGVIPICDSCKVGIVKPCITFFGESLPDNFFLRLNDFNACDLLIVIGTSLKVQPFASLIDSVGEKTPRLLINLEKVGDIGLPDTDMGFDFDGKYHKYRRDAFYKGTCDEGVKRLAELCGFKDELLQIYEEGHASLKKQYGITPTVTKVEEKTKVELKASSEIVDTDEVDQMLKDFEKINLKGRKSDEELLNEGDISKLDKDKEKDELKVKNNKENDKEKEELKDKNNKENDKEKEELKDKINKANDKEEEEVKGK